MTAGGPAPRRIIATRVAADEPIDITDWCLPAFEKASRALKTLILKAAGEAISFSAEYEISAYFPYEWASGDNPSDGRGGAPPADPVTLYVELPIGVEDEGPIWSFSLRDIVKQSIDLYADRNGTIDRHEGAAVIKIGEELRKLAQMIDDAIVDTPRDGGGTG